MPTLAYTWTDIFHFLAALTGALILLSVTIVLVIGTLSCLLIKTTTKLGWGYSSLIGFGIGVGSCKFILMYL